ncbi:MAG: glutamate 5-kinase, partial [Candidatus Sericytochromatia bacterium]
MPHHRTVVLKIGTSTLIGADGPDTALLGRLADVVAALTSARNRCVIVTSGAVGTGRWRLKASGKPRSIPEKQAAAAVGQGLLMNAYERLFAER